MTRLLLMAVLAVCASGCRRSPAPLSGGKPVSHWIAALQGPDARLRKTAAFKLGNVGPSAPAVLPALQSALKDGDAAVRREAILALMKFGAAARAVVPALAEMQQRDADERVRDCAAQAYQKLTGAAAR